MTAEQRVASTRPDRPDGGQRTENRGGTAAEREYEDYVRDRRGADTDEPDVLLDVPVVNVDEINLEVEELRARVSLQAEVLDLLKLNVGADVFIGQVALEIKGVNAQALLKVRLDNVAQIVDRVLATIDRNPQIIEQITEGVRPAVEDLAGGAGSAVGELGEGAGEAVEETGESVQRTAGRAAQTAGKAAGGVRETAGRSKPAIGKSGGRARQSTSRPKSTDDR